MGETLSPDDVVYHQKVLEATRAASAIQAHWVAHITAKYGLNDGDEVDVDGTIRRRANLVILNQVDT